MILLRLCAALVSVSLGIALCARRKQPLFFKILLFAAASYLLGAVFEGCWTLVYGAAPDGFHIGYLGYVGMWFFLFSSYFGAIDRLADGGERAYRPYRLTALAAPLALLGLTVGSVVRCGAGTSLPLLLLAVPMGATLYFALKHLLLPDVEMGIIRVMRPYNALVLLLGLGQAALLSPGLPDGVRLAVTAAVCVLLAAMLPMAEMGVRKWYM